MDWITDILINIKVFANFPTRLIPMVETPSGGSSGLQSRLPESGALARSAQLHLQRLTSRLFERF
jgi:hypothetical protein